MKFNKYKISHYFIFSFSAINYLFVIFLKKFKNTRNNNILLFGHKLVGNLEVIFKDMRFASNDIYYITLNYKDYLRLRKLYGNKILTPLNIFQLFKGLNCKILIASHGIFFHNLIKKLGIKTILCGHAIHGAIVKNKESNIKFYETFDEVWLHSPYDKKIVIEELLCKPFNLNVIGFVRNQLLTERVLNTENLKAVNGLNEKKVILYAPTANRGNTEYMNSKFSISNMEFYKFISTLLKNLGITLIIKTHLNDTISNDIRQFVHNNPNILFHEDLDMSYDYDSLLISDILITDISTIYVDYLLLEKPVFIVNNPDPDIKKRKKSSILQDIKLPKIKNYSDLEEIIIKLDQSKFETENIKKLKNEIYNDFTHSKTIEKINEVFSVEPFKN